MIYLKTAAMIPLDIVLFLLGHLEVEILDTRLSAKAPVVRAAEFLVLLLPLSFITFES